MLAIIMRVGDKDPHRPTMITVFAHASDPHPTQTV